MSADTTFTIHDAILGAIEGADWFNGMTHEGRDRLLTEATDAAVSVVERYRAKEVMPREVSWLLVGEEVQEDGSWLFWSNEGGWVDRESATIFTTEEMEAFSEPQGTFAWTPAK